MTIHQIAEHNKVSRQAVYQLIALKGWRPPLSEQEERWIHEKYEKRRQEHADFVISAAGVRKKYDEMVDALVTNCDISREHASLLVRRANLSSPEERWKLYKRAFQ